MKNLKKILLLLITLAVTNYNLKAWIAELLVENDTAYPIDVHTASVPKNMYYEQGLILGEDRSRDYKIDPRKVANLKPLEIEQIIGFTIKYSPKYSSYLGNMMGGINITQDIKEYLKKSNEKEDSMGLIKVEETKGWTPKLGGYGLSYSFRKFPMNNLLPIKIELYNINHGLKKELIERDIYKLDPNIRKFINIIDIVTQVQDQNYLFNEAAMWHIELIQKNKTTIIDKYSKDKNKTLAEMDVKSGDIINIYINEPDKPYEQPKPKQQDEPKKEQPQQPKKPAPQPQMPQQPQSTALTPYKILGLPDKANDLQILGLTWKQLKDKSAVKRAYVKLSLTWHPDKINDNKVKKIGFSDPKVENLIGPNPDERKIKALAEEIFKLISNAYERNK